MDPSQLDEFAETAHKLVDQVITNAVKHLKDEDLDRQRTFESIRFDLSRENTEEFARPSYEDYNIKNISWLTIEQFSIDAASQKIHDFIQTWQYEDSWLFCVDYLGEDGHEFDTRYRFRVRWSIPTRRKPVPRATASVYFTFEVSKIKPKNYPVDVYYVFETNRLVHRPGQSRFREQWLKEIIENKYIILSAIDF